MFIKLFLMLLIASPCMADVIADDMPWRNDPHVLIALEKPRFHYEIQKAEPIIVYGDVQVTTCVKLDWEDDSECKPLRGFIQSEFESEDL